METWITVRTTLIDASESKYSFECTCEMDVYVRDIPGIVSAFGCQKVTCVYCGDVHAFRVNNNLIELRTESCVK